MTPAPLFRDNVIDPELLIYRHSPFGYAALRDNRDRLFNRPINRASRRSMSGSSRFLNYKFYTQLKNRQPYLVPFLNSTTFVKKA